VNDVTKNQTQTLFELKCKRSSDLKLCQLHCCVSFWHHNMLDFSKIMSVLVVIRLFYNTITAILNTMTMINMIMDIDHSQTAGLRQKGFVVDSNNRPIGMCWNKECMCYKCRCYQNTITYTCTSGCLVSCRKPRVCYSQRRPLQTDRVNK